MDVPTPYNTSVNVITCNTQDFHEPVLEFVLEYLNAKLL